MALDEGLWSAEAYDAIERDPPALGAGARRGLSFRLEAYGTGEEALLAAVSLGVLVLTLTVGYFLLDRVSVPGRLEL